MTAVFSPGLLRQPRLHPASTQRILSLHFPHLAADRVARLRWGASWLSRGRPEHHPPVVFSGRVKTAICLVELDRLAQESGFKHGQSVTEARAILPGIDILPAEPAADAAFLKGLADWCDRYTPLVSLDGKDGLYLDITGCAHLFGGEKSLLDDILSRLFHLGVEACAAISSTPGLSWAMARYGAETIIATEDAEQALAPLPLSALRLPLETVGILSKLGLKRIGDLLHAPRAPLARRFGPALLLRLDQALGLEDEPLSPRLPVADFSAERRLMQPVQGEDDILWIIGHLAGDIRTNLERKGEGGRQFELLLFRVDGEVFRTRAQSSVPLNDPRRIEALFRERLDVARDDLDAGYGFEILRLCVLKSERLDPSQKDFSGDDRENRSLADFIDKVTARFGPDHVQGVELVESHVPERATRLRPATDMPALAVSDAPSSSPSRFMPARPLRLLTHPEPVDATSEIPEGPPRSFRWRRAHHRLQRAEGPERIAPEWWHNGDVGRTRDYFRVEDDEGRRFWLFREGFYGETLPPRWFLQGFFA